MSVDFKLSCVLFDLDGTLVDTAPDLILLMDALRLTDRTACIISGDTTANPKPHVEPMLAACKQAAVKPQECVYIGDASHDITAGKNARMKTLAALYGYLKPGDTPETWGADALIESPEQLATWITSALCH